MLAERYEADPDFRAFIRTKLETGLLSRSDFVAAALIDISLEPEERIKPEWVRLRHLNIRLVIQHERENSPREAEEN